MLRHSRLVIACFIDLITVMTDKKSYTDCWVSGCFKRWGHFFGLNKKVTKQSHFVMTFFGFIIWLLHTEYFILSILRLCILHSTTPPFESAIRLNCVLSFPTLWPCLKSRCSHVLRFPRCVYLPLACQAVEGNRCTFLHQNPQAQTLFCFTARAVSVLNVDAEMFFLQIKFVHFFAHVLHQYRRLFMASVTTSYQCFCLPQASKHLMTSPPL